MKKLFFLLFLLAGMSQAQTTVAPFLSSQIQLLDNNGIVCAGCLLDTFAAGTTNALATYSESTGTTPNANPIVLSAAGRATVYLTSASYKFRLRSALGVTIWTQDNVSFANLANTVSSLISNGTLQVIPATAATGGANQTGPNLQDCGNYWTGSVSAADCWTLADVLGTGSNPTSTFTLTHSGSSGAATFSIPGNVSVGGTLNGATIGGVVYADQKCTSAGVFDSTCFTNAVAALPNGGWVIVNAHTYNFGAITATFAPSNSNIKFLGVCLGNFLSLCPRIQGTASPLIGLQGTNASTRTVNMIFEGIVFQPSAFSASQICLQSDHATQIYLRDVTFENCGQAEDINDVYRQVHYNVTYDNCGSGDTAATACVRAENRSNPSVRTEEIYWDRGLWQGAAHQGMALWAGPFTQEVAVANSKLDYGGSTPTFRLIAFNNSWQGGVFNSEIAAATITTASAVIEISGTDASTRSFNISVNDNPVLSTQGTIPAVKFDWAKWSHASLNGLNGTGTATGLVTLTANSLDNVAAGNSSINSGDVTALDSGTNNSIFNHQAGTSDWKFGAGSATAGIFTGTSNVIAGTSGTTGRVQLTTGSAGATGFVEWRLANGTRLGFMGNSATDEVLTLENGATFIVTGGASNFGTSISSPLYKTTTNCTSTGGTCVAAPAGAVTIAAAASTVTVATTAVTANSDITLTRNDALGTRLSVTCNTATAAGDIKVSTITPGTSFVITVQNAPAVNPLCLTYSIVN